jgi:hypothetical protein
LELASDSFMFFIARKILCLLIVSQLHVLLEFIWKEPPALTTLAGGDLTKTTYAIVKPVRA